MKNRRRRTDAGFAIAAYRLGDADDPGHEWGLREIAPAQLARPAPILGFVDEQIDVGERKAHKPDDGDGDEDPNDELEVRLELPVVYRADKFGHGACSGKQTEQSDEPVLAATGTPSSCAGTAAGGFRILKTKIGTMLV